MPVNDTGRLFSIFHPIILLSINWYLNMHEIGYKKISVGGSYYIYDTSTNDLIKVNKTVYRLIDYYIGTIPIASKDKSEKMVSDSDALVVLDFIDRVQREHGMFQPYRQKDFSMYLDREFLGRVLSQDLRFLLLNVTEQCNQRCTYCLYSGKHIGRRSHDDRFMTWDIARKSIDFFLARASTEDRTSISFYGGEPLLNYELIKQCVKYIRGQETPGRLTVSIGTNATLCNDEMIDFFIENDLVLFISLDGPPDVHDSARVYRNARSTHAKVVDVLRRINEKNRHYFHNRVCLLTTYDERNDLLDVCRYFSQELFNTISVRLNHVRGLEVRSQSIRESNEIRYQQNLDALMEFYLAGLRESIPLNFSFVSSAFRRVFRLLPQREIGSAGVRARPNRACIPGISQLFVSSDGSFYTCNHFCSPGYEIGHYRSGFDIEKIYGLLATYVEYCDELCQQCWAYRLCWHCFVQALENGRISKKKKAKNCIREKHDIVQDLKRFVYLLENEPEDASGYKFSLKSRLRWRNVRYSQIKETRKKSRLQIKDLPETLQVLG
jgi:uncharacterized protein